MFQEQYNAGVLSSMLEDRFHPARIRLICPAAHFAPVHRCCTSCEAICNMVRPITQCNSRIELLSGERQVHAWIPRMWNAISSKEVCASRLACNPRTEIFCYFNILSTLEKRQGFVRKALFGKYTYTPRAVLLIWDRGLRLSRHSQYCVHRWYLTLSMRRCVFFCVRRAALRSWMDFIRRMDFIFARHANESHEVTPTPRRIPITLRTTSQAHNNKYEPAQELVVRNWTKTYRCVLTTNKIAGARQGISDSSLSWRLFNCSIREAGQNVQAACAPNRGAKQKVRALWL